jgi:hypothetical protein
LLFCRRCLPKTFVASLSYSQVARELPRMASHGRELTTLLQQVEHEDTPSNEAMEEVATKACHLFHVCLSFFHLFNSFSLNFWNLEL